MILGSTKELGSWKNHVPLNWTPDGWVCELELKESSEEMIEFKFVIVGKDGSLVWEGGDNRVLKLPPEGGGAANYGVVATWNATHHNMDLLPLELELDLDNHHHSHSAAAAAETTIINEPSPFVGQWQGKSVSFMQSNDDHSSTHRKWDTSALQGLPLKLVQHDQNARNWWRKLDIVRDIITQSLQGTEHPILEALIYSAIYLKVVCFSLSFS